jgi:hypothetical protein
LRPAKYSSSFYIWIYGGLAVDNHPLRGERRFDAFIPVGDVQPSCGRRPRIRSPKEATDPEGVVTPEAKTCNPFRVRAGAGSGTRRALPDAKFCGPFRAERLRNSDVD